MNPKSEEIDKLPGMDELIAKLRREGFYDQDPTKYQSIHGIGSESSLSESRRPVRELRNATEQSV